MKARCVVLALLALAGGCSAPAGSPGQVGSAMVHLKEASDAEVAQESAALAAATAAAQAEAEAAAVARRSAPGPRTQVAVLGTLHERHRTSTRFGLDQVRQVVVNFAPDVVCCELPQDRWERIQRDWTERHVVEDQRARALPECSDVLLPLRDERPFLVEPCGVWSRELADEREERLAALATDPGLAALNAEYVRRNAELTGLYAGRREDIDDPRVIHTEAYDRRTREELRPYDELLNGYIGRGGWTNLNTAQMALIDAVLDRHRGERVLVMFGAAHKAWLRERLAQRLDVELLDVVPYLPTP